jgi:uncharacterized membrane protein (DUF485 family)
MAHDDAQAGEKTGDPTPQVGAETDVSPLGRDGAKPAHERTADEDRDLADWEGIAASDEFRALVRTKLRFIVPATIFFLVYYFALPVLVGYAPELMKRPVCGPVNVAYLFALSQFFMTWIIAVLYVRAAGRHDRMARNIVAEHNERQGGQEG